jgi:hypothetical protein
MGATVTHQDRKFVFDGPFNYLIEIYSFGRRRHCRSPCLPTYLPTPTTRTGTDNWLITGESKHVSYSRGELPSLGLLVLQQAIDICGCVM